MDYQTVRDEITPSGIGILTLNRPEKRNALSILMRTEISRCLAAWEKSDAVAAAVLTGAGSAFSAGYDLSEFGQDVWRFPKPIIAAVNGPAMGGAFDLATLCDIRICSPSASFGHPEIKFGVPPLVTPLRWIVGQGLARDLVLTGRTIAAEDARRIGLVSQVVEADKLMGEALRTADRIAETPRETLRFTKRVALDVGEGGFEDSFRIEDDRAFVDIVRPLVSAGLLGSASRRPRS